MFLDISSGLDNIYQKENFKFELAPSMLPLGHKHPFISRITLASGSQPTGWKWSSNLAQTIPVGNPEGSHGIYAEGTFSANRR